MLFPTRLLIYDDVREQLELKSSCAILHNYMPWDFFGDLKPLIVLTFQLKHACSEEVKIIQVERLTEVESIEFFRSWWEISKQELQRDTPLFDGADTAAVKNCWGLSLEPAASNWKFKLRADKILNRRA